MRDHIVPEAGRFMAAFYKVVATEFLKSDIEVSGVNWKEFSLYVEKRTYRDKLFKGDIST